MAKSKQKKVLTALSLQGGGALGAYEYGMLKALYVKRGKTFRPRVVTGVSIGAINAAFRVGAKGDPIEALDTLWRERLCVTWPAPSCTMPEAMYHHEHPGHLEQAKRESEEYLRRAARKLRAEPEPKAKETGEEDSEG